MTRRTVRRAALVLTTTALLAGAGWNATTAAAAPQPDVPSVAVAAPPTSLSVGPVTLAGVPMRVCVGGSCQPTPAVSSAALDLAAATTGGTSPAPGIVEQRCPAGVGLGAVVSGPKGTVVSGTLTLVLNGGTRVGLPVNQTVPEAGSLTITACTA